jgi:magnesium transporter
MKKAIKKRKKRDRKRIGEVPGSIIYVGAEKERPTALTYIHYSASTFSERAVDNWEDVKIVSDETCWIHLDGIHEVQKIKALESKFGIHSLALEDSVNTLQRPKLEEYSGVLHVVLKYWHPPVGGQDEFSLEQVSFFLGKGFVVSLQENNDPLFLPITERLRNGRGIIRSTGADYLLYSLVDVVVDSYFSVVDYFNEEIEEIETRLQDDFSSALLRDMYLLKRNLLYYKKSITPVREVITGLQRSQGGFIEERTRVYLRDVYDHLLEVLDSLDTNREIISLMIDYYLSLVSSKTNEVAKVLTAMTALFAPPTLIAGIYGMNFHHMPELAIPGAYWTVLVIMLFVMIGVWLFIRRRRWL